MHSMKLGYLPLRYSDYQIEDSDKWEVYVKYRRQIVSQFLIGHMIPRDTHNPSESFLFSSWSKRGQENYVNLAKYLLSFLSEGLSFR